MFSQTVDPSIRFRQACQSPTASLSYIQRLSLKLADLRNTDPASRQTSLHLAALAGRIDVCLWLIEDGHDDDEISQDAAGETIAHIAAGLGHLELLQVYLDQYPFVLGLTNLKGATALHVAAMRDQPETAEFLISFGSDINAPDLRGETPLHYASAWGKLAVVQLLVEAGADHTAKNNPGYTAAEYSYSFAGLKALESFVKQRAEQLKREQKESARKPSSRLAEKLSPSKLKRSPKNGNGSATGQEDSVPPHAGADGHQSTTVGLGFDFKDSNTIQQQQTVRQTEQHPHLPSTPPRVTSQFLSDQRTTMSPSSISMTHSHRTASHDSSHPSEQLQHSFGGLELDERDESDHEEGNETGNSSDRPPSAGAGATLSPPAPLFRTSPATERTRKDSSASQMSTNSRMSRMFGLGKKS